MADNNKNNNDIQLPLYLQKNIIKHLCHHINKNNKVIDYIGQKIGYRVHEKEIKKLMITLALVNKEWFKTLSNNINVAIDFNYKEKVAKDDSGVCNTSSEWSIIKEENIKTMKLHFDHETEQMYEMVNGESVVIAISTVNEKLDRLSNLEFGCFKKLIIRNVYTEPDAFGVKVLELLNRYPIFKNNIHIYEIILNNKTTLKSLESIEYVKSLFSIIIEGCSNQEIFLKTFKLWYHKLNKLQIKKTGDTNFKLFELLSEQSDNKQLSNITHITYTDTRLTIKDFACVMKYAKKLTNLSIRLCYRNLLYFLTSEEERKNDSIQRCVCSSISKRKSNMWAQQSNEDRQIEQQEFNENWSNLKELFKENKTLKYLGLNCDCTSHGGIFGWNKNKPLPDSFINEINSLLSQNTCIVKFVFLSCITTQIHQEIFKNNNTIVEFEVSALDNTCAFEKCTNEYKALVEQTDHIQVFKYRKNVYNYEKAEYNDITLFEYNK